MLRFSFPSLRSLVALTVFFMTSVFAQTTDKNSLPDLGSPSDSSASIQPNINADSAGFSYRDNINGKLLSINPQYNRQNGAALGGSLASPFGENIAAGILLMAGEDRNEWLVNVGANLNNRHRVIFSLGQLGQKLNFNFLSGSQKAEVRQDNSAVSYQYLLGQGWLNAAEINAYITHADSKDLADKTYSTETVSLYELWNDSRRIAGSRVIGTQGKLVFTPTSTTTLKLGLGAESLKYNYLTGNETTTRATGSAEVLQRLDHGFNLRASANLAASQNRYALGFGKNFNDGAQLGIDFLTIDGSDGLFNDKQVQLTYTQPFGARNNTTSTSNTAAFNNLVGNTWASSLVEQVSRRPSFLPSQVIAKVDSTATPTRLIAIDKSNIPAGSSINTSSGSLTVPIGVSVSAIAGVTLNGSVFTNSGQFALSGSTDLVVNPNLIAQPSATDTYVVTMNNTSGGGTTLATITVSHGSTKIDSVVISSGTLVINTAAISGVTAPVAAATPVTSVTGTGYTGVVTWSSNPTTFGFATTYTATITLTPTAGYTLTGVAANFFTVSGATSVANSANSGVVTAVFPATSALPSGYIQQGGLIWAPINTMQQWPAIYSTCSSSTSLGYSAGTWRMPTQTELLGLQASLGGVAPTGWTLGWTWSSTVLGVDTHSAVHLISGGYGGVGTDTGTQAYTSCVH